MKILSAQQIREADQYTIEHEPIASEDLMERAAGVFVKWLSEKFSKGHPVKFFCGIGNNGGDGLVSARLLALKGYNVEVFVARYSPAPSKDFLANEQKLRGKVKLTDINAGDSFPEISASEIVVDALWGSGLNRPIEGFSADLIAYLNDSPAIKVAIDIPSGLYADSYSDSTKFKADFTLSFELPKLSFLLPESSAYAGEWTIKSIGIHSGFLSEVVAENFLITAEMARSIIIPRKKFDHKGTFGHSLIISGSYGKMGAAKLCAEACLRAGAGLVTAYIPRCGYQILQTALSEVMVITDKQEHFIGEVPELEIYKAIGAGPGIGTDKLTVKAVKKLLENANSPLVLDADALNIISENKEWLKLIPENSILTPHPKEFERLFGKSKNDFERHRLQKVSAKKYKLYIVLKLGHTAIATPRGETFFNSTGNPGMATAGAGDVLTGVITGLLSQGYSPQHSAILGAFWHGLAGDFAAEEFGQLSMIASDITNHLGNAFKKIIT